MLLYALSKPADKKKISFHRCRLPNAILIEIEADSQKAYRERDM